uniref:Uncharacterized protein n=1 Tax=Faecalibaculum rodentium TaxID=1702221 RepID=A0A140DS19_9FIRM|nr:hypothetical protein AALO17_03120 [Faecalibaculum rodentium]
MSTVSINFSNKLFQILLEYTGFSVYFCLIVLTPVTEHGIKEL